MGGDASVSTGSGAGGGALDLRAGRSQSDELEGGVVTVESGTGGASSGSGDVAIPSAPQATGVTGAVALGSGPNVGGAGTGDVRIASGAASGEATSSKSGTTFIAAGDAAGGAGGDVSVQAGRSGGASAESGGHVMLLGRDASGLDVAGGAVEVGSGTSVAGEGGLTDAGGRRLGSHPGRQRGFTSGQAGSGVDGASSGPVSMTSASATERRCDAFHWHCGIRIFWNPDSRHW